MRMPFIEFFTNGDVKFIVVFIIFSVVAIIHFIKKIKAKDDSDKNWDIDHHNSRIDIAAFWILTSAILSLMLGLMHSFFFIGKAGGISPNLLFQGISYTLITPVMGIGLFMVCKILRGTFNPKTI